MPYRNIDIPQEYLDFIQAHRKLHKGTLQRFVVKAIQEEIEVQKQIIQKSEEIKKKRSNVIH